MNQQKVVVESPLKGDFATNRLYATWCCRHLHESGFAPIASHLLDPWFLDDREEADRAAGISMPWFWLPDAPHFFFVDLGLSSGMVAARLRCTELGIPISEDCRLPALLWEAFRRGEQPPHTPGFEVHAASG
jgi:hypothetical protein